MTEDIVARLRGAVAITETFAGSRQMAEGRVYHGCLPHSCLLHNHLGLAIDPCGCRFGCPYNLICNCGHTGVMAGLLMEMGDSGIVANVARFGRSERKCGTYVDSMYMCSILESERPFSLFPAFIYQYMKATSD